jgi:hypothetical protein
MNDYTCEMPKASKRAWIQALRSGKYKQGTGKLYNELHDTYCCLGVLQKVLDGKVEPAPKARAIALPTNKWFKDHGIVNYVACGLVGDKGSLRLGYDLAHHLNDCLRMSFEQIADYVERFVKGI